MAGGQPLSELSHSGIAFFGPTPTAPPVWTPPPPPPPLFPTPRSMPDEGRRTTSWPTNQNLSHLTSRHIVTDFAFAVSIVSCQLNSVHSWNFSYSLQLYTFSFSMASPTPVHFFSHGSTMMLGEESASATYWKKCGDEALKNGVKHVVMMVYPPSLARLINRLCSFISRAHTGRHSVTRSKWQQIPNRKRVQ